MANNVVSIEGGDLPPKKERTPQGWHKFWQKELEASTKRLRTFTKQGNGVVARYQDEKNTATAGDYDQALNLGAGVGGSLNLFWSNITTLQSMLYGSTPKIDVSREHHDPDDDIARVAATLFQRILQADVYAKGEDFPTTLKAALQDRLLPGLGLARVTYSLKTSTAEVPNPATGLTESIEQVDSEEAGCEYVHWQDAKWGWGRTWSEIPWWGFRAWMTKDEAAERFDAKIANVLTYKNQSPAGDNKESEDTNADQQNNVEKAEIWEFWCKKTKKVYWYSEGADIILDAKDDPLQLAGFWPMPRPMTANLTTTLYRPKADFCMAQDLYNEIDRLQARISNITNACKVVGVYDQSAGDSVGRMLKEGNENELIPVPNWAMFAEKGGLTGTIDWFPLKDVVATLQTLIGVRDQTIGLLHEVTGMSDLIRGGSTDQYTSDGTNQLKAKFGSIRVQAIQDEFARFASDLEALKAEVISKHYRPESIIRQSSAQYIAEVDRDKIGPALQLMKSPEVQWRVDIRPETIAMIDYAQLKSERTEYLTAIATFLQSAAPMMQAMPESTPLMLEFLKFGMVAFKGSGDMEGILDQAIDQAKKAPPKGEDDGSAAEKAKSDGALAVIDAKHKAAMEENNQKIMGELKKIQDENQATLREIAAGQQADTNKILTDLQADLKVIAAKLSADTSVEQTQSQMAIAEEQTQHADALQLSTVEHGYRMEEITKQGKIAAQKPAGEPDGDE